MAKARKEVPQQPEAVILDEMIETGSELQTALDRIFAEAGTSSAEIDAVAHVYMVEPGGTEPKIWKGPPSEYDLDKLAREHGSGDYRLKVYAPDDTGQTRLRLNKVFPYRLSAEADARLRAIRKGEVIPATGAHPVGLSAKDIADIIDARIKAVQAPAVDPFAMMDKLAGVMSKMMPPATAHVNGEDTFMRTMNAAKQLLEISRGFNSGGDSVPEKPGDRAMARGVDMLFTALERGATAQAQAQPAANAQAQPKPTDGMTPEQIEEYEMMQMALRFAVRSARNNVPAAEFVLEHGEDIPIEVVAQLYSDPKWFETICANVPDAAKYAEWFSALRQALIDDAIKNNELTADGKIVDAAADGTTDAGAGSKS